MEELTAEHTQNTFIVDMLRARKIPTGPSAGLTAGPSADPVMDPGLDPVLDSLLDPGLGTVHRITHKLY